MVWGYIGPAPPWYVGILTLLLGIAIVMLNTAMVMLTNRVKAQQTNNQIQNF